jgi:glycosyltransferase involved in cell wall biosynthesis
VGDVDALAAAMAWILDRPKDAAEMAKLAYERISTYDLNAIIQLHEQLYLTAMK